MEVKGRNLFMVRGDTEQIIVSCAEDIQLEQGDAIEFTVRETAESPVRIIYKSVTEFTDNSATIDIEPEDTNGKKFGSYVYDIQLTKANGDITTIVKLASFTLEKEATYVSNSYSR